MEVVIDLSVMESVAQTPLKILDAMTDDYSETLKEWATDYVLPYWESHWGEDMPPLEQSTIDYKASRKLDPRPVVRYGTLIGAATLPGSVGNILETTKDSLTVGVSGDIVPYAIYQHEGFEHYAYGPVPPRPWDTIPDQLFVKLEELVLRQIESRFG